MRPHYFGLWLRNRNRPRRRTGSGRVRERFEAVEMPLNRTNQSQKARQRVLVWVLMLPDFLDRFDSAGATKVHQPNAFLRARLRLRGGRGLLGRAGDAEAHEEEAKAFAQ